MDWRQAAAQHGITVEELKEKLPLDWVINVAAGVPLDYTSEGRAIGICPFHDDTDPSLDVYGYGTRWGCFPCGEGGDVFDFIGSFWELGDFAARLQKAIELYQQFQGEDGWQGILPSEEPAAPVTVNELLAEVASAQSIFDSGIQFPLSQLLSSKQGLDIIPVEYLRTVWGVGVSHDYEILAPYWDDQAELVSYKTRFPNRGGWYARKGRKLTSLYGEWQLGDHKNVWLTEGETDTWLASYLLQGRGVALGLPRGAGANIDQHFLDLLAGRRVTIVFDNDVAGRRAARKWYDALEGVAEEIHVSFPDTDLRESSNPQWVLDNGLTVTKADGYAIVRADGMCYQQLTRNGVGENINDWVLEPTKYIAYRGLNGDQIGTGYEGHFTDDRRRKVLITSGDLENSASAVKWSNAHRRVWFSGGGKYTQSVLSLLNEHAPFLPRVDAVSLIGLHGIDRHQPVFVLPESVGSTIGSPIAKEKWTHSTADMVVNYGDNYELREEKLGTEQLQTWAARVIPAMLNVNQQNVITPIIAWLAAAPLRSLVREFPPLAVMGGSGSGKTSLMQEILNVWYGLRSENNLATSSTPYGLSQWAVGTNALPVWYDEYRNGVRESNLEMINQLLRDAWTASSSSRGGVGEDKSKVRVSKVTAPIIVSGESELEERSHIDRVINVRLPDKNSPVGMNPTAFQILRDSKQQPGRLGRQYLEWLVYQLELDNIVPPASALDRQTQGENILRWGWSLFSRFCADVLGVEVGELITEKVETTRKEADEHVVLSAIADALESKASDENGWPIVAVQEQPSADGVLKSVVAIRMQRFYRWAIRNGYQFPGNQTATASWIKERFTTAPGKRAYFPDMLAPGGLRQLQALTVVGVLEAIEEDLA